MTGDEGLRRLFRPESIALVGFSERSPWSRLAAGNLAAAGFAGALHCVNPRGSVVLGHRTVTSCAAIGEAIDLAVLLVPNAAVPDAMRDAAAAGAGAVVMLGAGFGEAGEAGRAAQAQLRELAADLGLAVLGPNCLGFANLADRTVAWTGVLPSGLTAGPVALVSQSGNVALALAEHCVHQRIGVSHMVSTGNEVCLGVMDVVDHLLDDDRVRAFAVFAESLRDPRRFLDVAAAAAQRSKPLVMLKVGTSPLAAALAATHTGAIAGDDRIVDAALRSAGVVRVSSMEELTVTAALLAHTGPLGPGGLGVVSMSGGSNDVIADRAAVVGVPLPALDDRTRRRLEPNRSELGWSDVHNPLDITGAAAGRLDEHFAEPLRAFADDPGIALVAAVFSLPDDAQPETYGKGLASVGKGLAAAGRRGVLLPNTQRSISPAAMEVVTAAGIGHVLAGIDVGMAAIGHAMRWSDWLRAAADRRAGTASPTTFAAPAGAHGSWSEARALELLGAAGVPAAPWKLATNADEAVAAGREIGFPVVVKVASPDILHKSDIGGVALGLRDDGDVAAAFARVTAAARRVEGATVDGALVAAMRSGGVELILGVVRHDDWGPVLAVGLGGVFANALDDTQLRLLPLDETDVRDMLARLRGARLLHGFRGAKAADLDRLAAIVVAFGKLAVSLGPDLQSMEINPLRVDGSVVEALDAVVTWSASHR